MKQLTHKEKLGTAWIGRNDGKSIKLPSEKAAMEVLAVIEKYDPKGVHAGEYFIDVERGESEPQTKLRSKKRKS